MTAGATAPLRTRSIYLAAFLLAHDHPLLRADAAPGSTFSTFVIGGDPDELQHRLNDWRVGTATVNGQRFVAEMRRLHAVVRGYE